MPSAQPQTKLDSILHELGEIAKSDQECDEFTLARLRREIESLSEADRVEGLIAQGALAAIERDLNEVHSSYELALNLAPDETLIHYNYSNSLRYLGIFSEAADQALLAATHESEAFVINNLIDALVEAGRFHQAVEWLAIWKEKTGRSHNREDRIVQISRFLDDSGESDSVTERLQQIAIGCIKGIERDFRPREYQVSMYEDEESGDRWAAFVHMIDAEVDDVFEVADEYAKLLAESGELTRAANNFVISFVPREGRSSAIASS